MALILASTSPYRRELLMRLGDPFECHPSGIDEGKFAADGIGPVELARTLATEKALKVVITHPLATIIGCGLAWIGLIVPALKPLYDYGWFVGFGASAVIHYALMKAVPPQSEQ